jgi:general secretion pathway protein M
MTARLAAMWKARTRRERWLLGIMLALLAFVLAWLLMLRPIGDMMSSARERHGRAVAALAEARAQAGVLKTLERGRARALPGPLEVVVGRAASETGFQLSRLDPQGPDRIALAIPAARPQALFGWVAQMESSHGLVVDRLSATANSDRTLSAEIVLRRRPQ